MLVMTICRVAISCKDINFKLQDGPQLQDQLCGCSIIRE
jgi:hypothetical protein